MQGEADTITPALQPHELTLSPALSILAKAVTTLEGRKVGVLLLDGFDPVLLTALKDSVKSEKASLFIVASSIAGATDSSGMLMPADGALGGSPSVFFDSVAILASKKPSKTLPLAAATTEWLEKAFNHRKVVGYSSGAKAILDRAHITADAGVVPLSGVSGVADYIKAAKHGRLWDRVLAGEVGADA